jgi:kynurenine formamidase
MRAWVGVAALLAASACAHLEAPEQLVDLTHSFGADTIYWPTEEGFFLEGEPGAVTEAGYYYEAHRFRAAEHGGTHVDAPIHFSAQGQRVDEIPLDRLVGPGVVVDVQAACRADRDHEIGVADLQAWESRHGAIPRGAIVLLYTGSGRYWPDRARYLGTAERGPAAVAALHFPGLSADAARWLVASRAIRAVGIDTASIDHGPSQRFETHQALSAANVPAFENVASLDLLPPRDFRVVALPMKIGGGSGAPLRIVAIVPGSAP